MLQNLNGETFLSSEELKGNVPTQSNKDESVYTYKDIFTIIFCLIMSIPKALFNSTIKTLFKTPKSLNKKICLVTGAGRGLGRELCLKLAKQGAEVVCVDIMEDINNETVKLIKDTGGKAHGYTCNVAKYEEVTKLAETVQRDVGRVYMLINNAGLVMVHKAGDWPPADVISMYNVNVISHYWTIKAFLPAMKEVNEGHIVNIVSIMSFVLSPGVSVYGATKAASDYMLRILRMELNCNKNNKIIVTGVHPSVINTGDEIKDMYKGGNLHMLEVKAVADEIIEEIRYDKTFIVIPKIFSLAMYLSEEAAMLVLNVMKIFVNVPDEKYKQGISFKKIQQKCV